MIYQGYPNLEYIIVDGASTDGTVEILRSYQDRFSWWVSEADSGHFDALNKGFARSSGEIMGWINASDQLHVGALFVVGSVFMTFPEVEWITGVPTMFNEWGMTIQVHGLPRWSRLRFLAGANRYIQQESTFWRRSLWERAGGHVDASRKIANDLELWVRFFRHARLYPVNALIGGYRVHCDAVSSRQKEECNRIHDEIIEAELRSLRWGSALRTIRRFSIAMQQTPKVRYFWWHLLMRQLYFWRGPDSTPIIENRENKWVMRP